MARSLPYPACPHARCPGSGAFKESGRRPGGRHARWPGRARPRRAPASFC